MEYLNSQGVTSLNDVIAPPENVELYKHLSKKGLLKNRVNLCMPVIPGQFNEELVKYFEETRQELKGESHPRLTALTVKMFLDGVVEYPNQTALLLEPYLIPEDQSLFETDPGSCVFVPGTSCGEPIWNIEEFNKIVAELDSRGFQVHIHTIGDAAVRKALDAFAYARDKNSWKKPNLNRHTIVHVQLVAPEDFPRFSELKVIASISPLWAQSGIYTVDALLPFIGPERHKYLYPFRSMADNGAILVGGSDWPVSPPDVIRSIETGILRKNSSPDPENPHPLDDVPLNPGQELKLDELIAAYTIDAAYALHQEDEVGSIEEGKKADFVVLSRNLFEIPPENISEVEIEKTIIEGEIVYDKKKQK
jgi:predicted amidohydrolase YtcJ